MVEKLNSLQSRLSALMGDDKTQEIGQFAQVSPIGQGSDLTVSHSPFEDILSKAVDAMTEVSKTEANANMLIDKYVHGQADLQDVMVASSKASVMVTMAVTTINLAVNTFKEITQMQV